MSVFAGEVLAQSAQGLEATPSAVSASREGGAEARGPVAAGGAAEPGVSAPTGPSVGGVTEKTLEGASRGSVSAVEGAPTVSADIRYVLGSSVNLRDKPTSGARIAGQLSIGTRVEVLERRSSLAWVRTDSGSQGWVEEGLLSRELPTVEGCLEAAAGATGREAVTWYLRAQGLAPWERQVLVGLEAAYLAVGEREKARGIGQLLDPRGPLRLVLCQDGRCHPILSYRDGKLASGQPGRGGSYFLLQDGRGVGMLELVSRADGRLDWPEALSGVGGPQLLASRLVQEQRQPAGWPKASSFADQVGMVLLARRPGWWQASQTGLRPKRVRSWSLGSRGEGSPLVIEATYQLDGLGGAPQGAVVGLVFGRLSADGDLEVEQLGGALTFVGLSVTGRGAEDKDAGGVGVEAGRQDVSPVTEREKSGPEGAPEKPRAWQDTGDLAKEERAGEGGEGPEPVKSRGRVKAPVVQPVVPCERVLGVLDVDGDGRAEVLTGRCEAGDGGLAVWRPGPVRYERQSLSVAGPGDGG